MSRAIDTGSRKRGPSPPQAPRAIHGEASRTIHGGKAPTAASKPDKKSIAVKAIA